MNANRRGLSSRGPDAARAIRTIVMAAGLAVWSIVALPAPASAAEEPRLGLPLDCVPGVSCVVQNYVDEDAGPGARDFACGSMTYDGHDGTDFRLPSMLAQRRGVDVLAALGGTVKGVRDGMDDVGLKGADPATIKGRECGNGVLIVSDDGWESQYCHMAKGSIRVAPGQTVAAGDRLGRVGLSGRTEFPHVHLTLRHGGKAVDPFAADAPANACKGGHTLWRPEVAAALAYRAPFILNTGFTTAAVSSDEIDNGRGDQEALTSQSVGLVAFARIIGVSAGDRHGLTITGPDGKVFATATSQPLDRAKAQVSVFVGRPRPAGGFAPGRYRAAVRVERTGQPAVERTFEIVVAASQ